MTDRQESSSVDFETRLLRQLCFLLLATLGMAVIGLAILVEPLAGYYADRSMVDAEQKQVDALQELHGQLDELLANTEHPAVIERAAINTLNYVSEQAMESEQTMLPQTWPRLEKALDQMSKPQEPPSGRLERFASALADHPFEQMLLLVFGSGLVVVSLTFFNRLRS